MKGYITSVLYMRGQRDGRSGLTEVEPACGKWGRPGSQNYREGQSALNTLWCSNDAA